MRRISAPLVAFVISMAFLVWFHGFATSARGWFPNDVLVRAWQQAQEVLPSNPHYTEPRVHDSTGVKILQPAQLSPGLTMITSAWKSTDGWGPQLRLINRYGGVVHKWDLEPTEYFSTEANRGDADLENALATKFYLFRNGDVIVNFNYVGTVRLDACGRVKWALPEGSHHTVTRANDGTFWIPAVAKEGSEVTAKYIDSYPGLGNPSHQNVLLNITEEGEVVDVISILKLLYENDLQHYLVKAHGHDKGIDVTHINDADPLSDSVADSYPAFDGGDLAVSSRTLDLVFVVDPDTREVKWHFSEPFIHQHDPDFMGNGWIGVFDNRDDRTNRGSMLGGSRIVAVHTESDSVRVLYPSSQADHFYTDVSGEWQQLKNGNLLLVEQMTGRVLEVNDQGRTVWEWINASYGDALVPEVPHAKRYRFSEDLIESWSCTGDDDVPAD